MIRLNEHQFSAVVHNAPRPMNAAEVPPYSRPSLHEGSTHKLNSLQRELNKHPGG